MLIVFGLLKKGKLQLDGHKLKRTGSDQGLRSYEREILKLIPTGGRTEPIPGDKVMKVFTGMIKELEKKMEDYSLKETREYYRSIINSAWRMLDNDISAEKAGEILGDRFQWLLADNRFEKRVKSFRTPAAPFCRYSCTAISREGPLFNRHRRRDKHFPGLFTGGRLPQERCRFGGKQHHIPHPDGYLKNEPGPGLHQQKQFRKRLRLRMRLRRLRLRLRGRGR